MPDRPIIGIKQNSKLEALAKIFNEYLFYKRFQDEISIARYKRQVPKPLGTSTTCCYGCSEINEQRKVAVSIKLSKGKLVYVFHESCYNKFITQLPSSKN
jgi:hypothetical protein